MIKESACHYFQAHRTILKLLFGWVLFSITPLSGQQTVLYREAAADYTNLLKEYDEGLYGRCIRSADSYLAT